MDTEIISSENRRYAYLNVAMSERGVAEYGGKVCVVFIPRDQIRAVEIRRGSQAERPLLQAIAGLVLAGLGAVGVWLYIAGGLAVLRWGLGFILFGALGAWLLWETLKPGYYLRVICTKDTRKLALKGRVSPEELAVLVKNAGQIGYDCRDCSNDSRL